jgi:hypothetical protein
MKMKKSANAKITAKNAGKDQRSDLSFHTMGRFASESTGLPSTVDGIMR